MYDRYLTALDDKEPNSYKNLYEGLVGWKLCYEVKNNGDALKFSFASWSDFFCIVEFFGEPFHEIYFKSFKGGCDKNVSFNDEEKYMTIKESFMEQLEAKLGLVDSNNNQHTFVRKQ